MKNWIIFLVGTVIGSIISLSVVYLIVNDNNEEPTKEIRQSGYQFINPLLECEKGEFLSHELQSFKNKITDLIDKQINSGQATFISAYFRDLNNGPWFGINEKEKFFPASLLKVPIMMAFYKESEINPDILKKELEYTDETGRHPHPSIRTHKIIC